MKRFFVFALSLAAVFAAFSSCGEKIDSGGSGSSYVFTDESDNITSTSARLHAHYNGTKIEGDNVGIICDKEGKLDATKSPRESSVTGEDGKFYVTFFDLTPNTVYEYMAYAKVEGKEYYGKKKSFKTKGVPVTSITIVPSEVNIVMDDKTTAQLTITVYPPNATDRSISLVSSDPSVATIGTDGVVTAKQGGTATITVRSVSTPSVSATCKVTVKGLKPDDAVDMGLPSGVYWRNRNLGASSVTDKGSRYAWASTTPKTKGFTKDTAPFYSNGYYRKYTAGHGNDESGTRNYLSSYDYEDDAARKLGGTWRVPSWNNVAELVNNCNITEETRSGVKGCVFKAKNPDRKGNKNELFFPYTGYMNGDTIYDPDYGFYWADQVYAYNPGYWDWTQSWNLQVFYPFEFLAAHHQRHYGQMIRPVCD